MVTGRSLSGSRAIVTGGLGFIGSSLALELQRQGADVAVVDNRDPEGGANSFNLRPSKPKIKVHELDVCETAALAKIVRDADFVFHVAARLSHVGSLEDPFEDLRTNAQGTLSVLEAVRRSKGSPTIFYGGTRAQYGRIKQIPVEETDPTEPTDPNGISKIAGEMYVQLYRDLYGIRYASLRLTNVYGPRQLMAHSRQGFLGWFFRQAIENNTIRIFGHGTQKRDVIYVDDAVKAFLLAAKRKQSWDECYNIGSGTLMDLLTIAQIIIQFSGSGHWKLVPWPKGYAKTEIGTYLAHIKKADERLRWHPEVPFVEGVRRTVEYYRSHKKQYW